MADESGNLPSGRVLVEERIVLWYLCAGFGYFLVSLLAGFYFSLQLLNLNPLAGIELFSPGRWRLVHTNGIAYGFLSNIFLGTLHWAIPRLTLKPVLSRALSWFIFGAWQVVVLGTVVGLLIGEAQGVEWGETPVWIDPLAQIGLLLVAINFMSPIVQMKGPMYVSLWYFTAAFIWTFLTYAMGNFIPEYFVSGTGAGALTGLFIHDLVGLWVTPIGWGMMYYFVPLMLKKPIWSHGLSLVGFWGLAFFYPLTGIHHFLYTPIPMFLQYGAVISTIAVEFVVTTVIVNFFVSIWGMSGVLKHDIPLRWFYVGMVNYFITCLQCAFQTTLTFQKLIHFTDWVVGHAHFVMFGVFGFWMLGIMTHLIPKLLRTPWYSTKLCEWHFWLSAAGNLLMFMGLTFAGIFEGVSWWSLENWEESIRAATPFWAFRTIVGLMIIAGQLCFLWNLIATIRIARRKEGPSHV